MTLNGYEYGWINLNVFISGGPAIPVRGITDIKYTTEREHANIYGRGHKPVAKGLGKKQFSGELTLLQSEVEELQKSLPAGFDLTDKDVDITVNYEGEDGSMVTDQLVGVRFGSVPKGMGVDTTYMPVTIPLTILDIRYNI